jgi:hypothetical protein
MVAATYRQDSVVSGNHWVGWRVRTRGRFPRPGPDLSAGAAAGYRAIVQYCRGYGSTKFSTQTYNQAAPEPEYASIENTLQMAPDIVVPTITIDGEYDSFTPAGDGAAYRGRVTEQGDAQDAAGLAERGEGAGRDARPGLVHAAEQGPRRDRGPVQAREVIPRPVRQKDF